VHPIYAALARQCGLSNGPYPAVTNIDSWPDKKTRERDLLWLDDVDRQVQAVHIRQFLATPAAAREVGLRIFLQRQLLKPDKQMSDRDKIDLLIVQYFVLCAPQDVIAVRVEFADVAKVLQPALGEVEETSLECCEPFERILESTQQCRSLRDLVELMQAGVNRYSQWLASLVEHSAGRAEVARLGRPEHDQRGRSFRGFNPFLEEDTQALETVLRGEYALGGLTARRLHSVFKDWTRGRIGRLLKRLRLHGLLRKIAHTHTYYLTPLAQRVLSTILHLKEYVFVQHLAAPAANS